MRPERPVILGDDGTGEAGTVLDAAFFNALLDYIDASVSEAHAAAARSELAQAKAVEIVEAGRRAFSIGGLQ